MKETSEKYQQFFETYIHSAKIGSNFQSNDNYIYSIPPAGIVINSPGIYKFGKNIEWSPTNDSVAITIVSSDVTLDLNGHSLTLIRRSFHSLRYSLTNTSKSSSAIGIVFGLVNNVKILNGKLINMRLFGIVGILASNVTIQDIHISKLTSSDKETISSGILLIASQNIHLEKLSFRKFKVCSTILAAILTVGCLNLEMNNIDISHLLNCTGVCSGINMLECLEVDIENININHLKTGYTLNKAAPGHTCIGIVPTQCSELIINNCTIKDIKGSCDDAHGISLFVVTNTVVSNVQVRNVFDGLKCKGAKATGIEVYAARDEIGNITVLNCNVENIIARNPGDRQCAGYSAAGSNITFDNCKATNIRVVGDDSTKGRVKGKGKGIGFGWAPDIRDEFIYPADNALFTKCVAIKCQVGFDTFNFQKSQWIQPQIMQCQTNILVEYSNTRVFFCDECSECPKSMKVNVDNQFRNNTIV